MPVPTTEMLLTCDGKRVLS